jgi:hypothetical protein
LGRPWWFFTAQDQDIGAGIMGTVIGCGAADIGIAVTGNLNRQSQSRSVQRTMM